MVVDDETLEWIRLDHTLAYLQRESCLCWLVGAPLIFFAYLSGYGYMCNL